MTVIHADFKSSKNLHSCIVPGSCSNASNYANASASANAPKCPIDAIGLIKNGVTTEGKLKKEYPKEFNSWRSRRFFAKKHNIPFFNNWDVFSVFLTYVGLCPSEGFTIDRIKHELGYVPDNIRWSSKQEQSENRDIVIWLEYEGKRLTLTAWAMRTRQKPNTLLRRHKAGWDTQGIITGVRPSFIPIQYRIPTDSPWPHAYAKQWESKYRASVNPATTTRIQYLLASIKEALKGVSSEQSYLLNAHYPNDPDVDYAIPIDVQERMQTLDNKRLLYQSFRTHANSWIKGRDKFLNNPVDWLN